jgi:hypothetical protein
MDGISRRIASNSRDSSHSRDAQSRASKPTSQQQQGRVKMQKNCQQERDASNSRDSSHSRDTKNRAYKPTTTVSLSLPSSHQTPVPQVLCFTGGFLSTLFPTKHQGYKYSVVPGVFSLPSSPPNTRATSTLFHRGFSLYPIPHQTPGLQVLCCAGGFLSTLFPTKHQGYKYLILLRRYDMNGKSQMPGGKNWIFPK